MKRFDQVNVIPFIDIMLVLLAIVLTTATFISQGKIEVALPDSENASDMSPEEALTITIDETGRYFLEEEPVEFKVLVERLKTLQKSEPILLYVDKAARFEAFVKVIDSLKGNALDNLSIVTRKTQ